MAADLRWRVVGSQASERRELAGAPRLVERALRSVHPGGCRKPVTGCEPFRDAGEEGVPVGVAGRGGLGVEEGPVPGWRFVVVFLEELEPNADRQCDLVVRRADPNRDYPPRVTTPRFAEIGSTITSRRRTWGATTRECRRLSVVSGQWSVVSGQWSKGDRVMGAVVVEAGYRLRGGPHDGDDPVEASCP